MNYTPLTLSKGGAKEAEPVIKPVERASVLPEVPKEAPATEQYLEQVLDEVPLSSDLEKAGVSHPPTKASIIVDGRKISLPMALEEVDDGMKQPMTSGRRWMALLVQYLLEKLHLVIKQVAGKIRVVHR